jgi:predicted alpha/beta hydrolase family esterase
MNEATAVGQILFLQGGGKNVHDEWDHKLVASLEHELGSDVEVCYPRMPNEDDPSFDAWSDSIESEIARLELGAFLVGHSVGGTILIHTLAQRPSLLRHIAAVWLLAAPFVGDGGWPSDEVASPQGWAEPLAEVPVYLYHGEADETVPVAHVDLYAKAIPHAQVRRLPGRDHQLNNDLSEVAQDIRRMMTH